MKLIKINQSIVLEAERRSEQMGILDSSRTKGKGNLAGFVGEILTAECSGGIIIDNFDYDLKIGSLKVDVKTKSCSSAPKPHYLCSVMEYQLKNEADGYYFCRVNLSTKEAWLLGYCSKQKLLEKGFFAKKGSPDGNFTFKEDCWNIKISELEDL